MTAPDRISVAVAGASGRMGRMLIEAIDASEDLVLTGALCSVGSEQTGRDALAFLGRSSQVQITSDIGSGLRGAHVLIDFTRPEATLSHLLACREQGVAAMIGTTGLGDAQREAILSYAKEMPIVLAPNTSVGLNVMLKLLDIATRSLSSSFDIEVIEAHHRHKVDAPSGTALAIGETIAAALGSSLSDCAVYERHGITGERKPGTVGFSVIRGGDIVGDHTVLFAGDQERIEITHRVSSRDTFAFGALRAARFVAGRPAGLYTMDDVLATC